MFGWYAHHSDEPERTPTFGIRLEFFEASTWLTVWFGRTKLMWRRIKPAKTRETGPSENRAVLGFFFRGRERRSKGRDFRSGFHHSKPLPPLSAAEIRKRNREAIEQGIVKPLTPGGLRIVE